ncbi:MAG: hypothetical protein Q9188_007012, partial [Gyalolechia gomerana]
MKSLQAYDHKEYSFTLTRIQYLISELLRIRSHPTPCELCVTDLLNGIAGNLNELLTYDPNSAIAQELADLGHLTKLSRQLLEIDESAITAAVWELTERKVKTLSNSRLAGCQASKWERGLDGRTSDQGRANRHDESSRRTLDVNIAERGPIQQQSAPIPSGFDFDVVERTPTQQSPAPKSSGIEFDVGERTSNQQPTAPIPSGFNFDVVERAPDQRPSAPRRSDLEFYVVERTSNQQSLAPRPSGSGPDVVERVLNQQPPSPRPRSFNFD